MKKMRRSTSDIISNLPESVKETILACLPIQDAVRTSVLSRKWRYTWTKLPQLVFDDTFCSDLFSKTKDKLMTIIYQVLLFHHGPIPKFTLSLSGLKSCSEFDQLIIFVSKKGSVYPSRTLTPPCRVLLGFILLKDNGYPSTPSTLLKPSEMVLPWSDSNMTEVSMAMLSRRIDRTILSPIRPFTALTSIPPVQPCCWGWSTVDVTMELTGEWRRTGVDRRVASEWD
ncbi:hypothetical protein ACSBR1_006516 [Camellia fascicularis]